jgi:predicted XRE-type DNA-binding protein
LFDSHDLLADKQLGRTSSRRAGGRLTQAKAAIMFGVSQPRVSDLMRGRIDRFSVDTLVAMLGQAGLRVRLVVGKRVA